MSQVCAIPLIAKGENKEPFDLPSADGTLTTIFMANGIERTPGFGERIGLAFKVLFDANIASKLLSALAEPPKAAAPPKPAAPPPEKVHASGLFVLGALQQEGRLIDFLQQDVAGFSDEEVGAAARVVHAGCRKMLQQYLSIAPVLNDAEGATVSVPSGFDAQRIRLTGNVTGQPPFKGSLKHHGWQAKELRFPSLAESLDARVLAPAEVEL